MVPVKILKPHSSTTAKKVAVFETFLLAIETLQAHGHGPAAVLTSAILHDLKKSKAVKVKRNLEMTVDCSKFRREQ